MEEPRLRELEAKLEIYKSTLTEIYERYDQKLEELSLIRRVGDALRSTMTVESLASALMATVAHEVQADRLAMVLRDPSEDQSSPLRLRAAYHAEREEFEAFEEGAGPIFDPGRLGPWNPGEPPRPRSIPEAAPGADPLSKDAGEAPRALLAAPFLVRDRLLGLLILSRPASQGFSAENGHMLSIMADQASAALANVQLFDDLSRINAKLIESEGRALETSRYLERLLESANDAILTLDSKGRVTYANRKAGQWGWSREDLLGLEFRSLLEDDPALADWAPGGPPPVDAILEARLVNQAGDPRVTLISTSRIGAEDPKEGEGDFLIMVSDLTERRQLERQLLHSEKLASIGVLAAGVAHEVGNPLSAISGYAQILVGADSETERREYLAAILNQTDRIQKILRELLDYSRPSRGLAETLDLAERIPAVMRMLESQRALARLKVVYDFPEGQGPWLVTMDRDHLAQVMVIIAMNAAQAMGDQVDPEPVLTISLSKEPGLSVLRVRDNGPGMSREVRRRALDPFFTTKGPGQGTGLGLAICQRIVESYHGRLDLETAEGRGAAFTIAWPEAR